jgi:hypothetical protein
VIHLYAVTRGVVPGSLRGLDDVPLSTVAVGDLRAVISRHEVAVPPTEAAALRHVTAIEALAEHADVLPVRFGSRHEDEADLHRRLEEQLPQLCDLLEQVGGHVEFVVRPSAAVPTSPAGQPSVLRLDEGATDAGTGRAYLERRLAEERAVADELAASRARLHDATEELVGAAAAVHELTSQRGPERCFLVARSAAASFGEQARQLVADSGRFVVGGPWPPFTFASLPVDVEVAR